MHVVVTGHMGYVGTVLMSHLRSAGHQAVGIDCGYFANCTLGRFAEPDGSRADVRDITPGLLGSADAIIHLAALSNDPLGDLDPATTYDVNLLATMRLAQAAKAAGVRRLLFSSSCSIYGACQEVLTEASALAPMTHYARSKMYAENGLRRLADARFSPVFLRSATAYGYSPRHRTDLVVNDLTAQAVLTGVITLQSDGMAWRPLVHVEDIAAAFTAVLATPPMITHGRAFNVGRTDENYRIRDVARIVVDVVEGSRLNLSPRASRDHRDYRVSCDRILADVPAYRPNWTVRRGVEHLVEIYRRHPLRPDDVTGPRFRRLPRIDELLRTKALDERLRWRGRSQ